MKGKVERPSFWGFFMKFLRWEQEWNNIVPLYVQYDWMVVLTKEWVSNILLKRVLLCFKEIKDSLDGVKDEYEKGFRSYLRTFLELNASIRSKSGDTHVISVIPFVYICLQTFYVYKMYLIPKEKGNHQMFTVNLMSQYIIYNKSTFFFLFVEEYFSSGNRLKKAGLLFLINCKSRRKQRYIKRSKLCCPIFKCKESGGVRDCCIVNVLLFNYMFCLYNFVITGYVMSGVLRGVVQGITALSRKSSVEDIRDPKKSKIPAVKESPGSAKRNRSLNSSLNTSAEADLKKSKVSDSWRDTSGGQSGLESDSDTVSESSEMSQIVNSGTAGTSSTFKSKLIVHRNHPTEKLNKEQVRLLLDQFGLLIDGLIKSGMSQLPIFGRHTLAEDGLIMRPENETSSQWLCTTIEEGFECEDLPELKVVELNPRKEVKLFKYTVRVPDDGARIEEMLQRLRAQNPGFPTKDWKVDKKQSHEEVSWMVLRVPEETHDALKARNGEVYYGITKIRFVLKDDEQGDEKGFVGKRRRK